MKEEGVYMRPTVAGGSRACRVQGVRDFALGWLAAAQALRWHSSAVAAPPALALKLQSRDGSTWLILLKAQGSI